MLILWIKQKSRSVIVLPHSAAPKCVSEESDELALSPDSLVLGQWPPAEGGYCIVFASLPLNLSVFLSPTRSLSGAGGDNGRVCSMSEWFYTTCSAACTHNGKGAFWQRGSFNDRYCHKYELWGVFFLARIPGNMRF